MNIGCRHSARDHTFPQNMANATWASVELLLQSARDRRSAKSGLSYNRIDLFKTARTGESGEFRFESVPPGDYKLFAWEDIDDGAWLDPDVIKLYESRGTAVAVGPAPDQTVTVGLIR